MITQDQANEWARDFLREHGIDRADVSDPDLMERAKRDRSVDTVGRAEEKIPRRYEDAIATDPDVLAWMAALVRCAIEDRRVHLSVRRGPSLLLLGPTGTGKSFQAYGMIRGIALLGILARWRVITAADFYARLRPRHGVDSEAEFAEYAGAAPLVIDDLGAVKNSEWVEEINYRLVNYRYEHMLPTLFTSNLLPGELANALGERVASRLKEMAGRVTLKGADRRYGSAA